MSTIETNFPFFTNVLLQFRKYVIPKTLSAKELLMIFRFEDIFYGTAQRSGCSFLR
jgi:hypothetical protein